jgi:hypothetical protein
LIGFSEASGGAVPEALNDFPALKFCHFFKSTLHVEAVLVRVAVPAGYVVEGVQLAGELEVHRVELAGELEERILALPVL